MNSNIKLHGYMFRNKYTKYYFYEYTDANKKYHLIGLKTNDLKEAEERALKLDKKYFGDTPIADPIVEKLHIKSKKKFMKKINEFEDFTHEDISLLVDSYIKVTDSTKYTDSDAIKEAGIMANIDAITPLLQKAIFGHRWIKEFNYIITPKYKAKRPSTKNQRIIMQVHIVKSLADEGSTKEEIAAMTNKPEEFVSSVLDGLLYPDIDN